MSPREIAAGLTQAQRKAIRAAKVVPGTRNTMALPVYRDRGVLVRSLVDLGLARGGRLNRKGLEVHAILQETDDGH